MSTLDSSAGCWVKSAHFKEDSKTWVALTEVKSEEELHRKWRTMDFVARERARRLREDEDNEVEDADLASLLQQEYETPMPHQSLEGAYAWPMELGN